MWRRGYTGFGSAIRFLNSVQRWVVVIGLIIITVIIIKNLPAFMEWMYP